MSWWGLGSGSGGPSAPHSSGRRTNAVLNPAFLAAWLERHPAFGAITRCVARDLRVHRTDPERVRRHGVPRQRPARAQRERTASDSNLYPLGVYVKTASPPAGPLIQGLRKQAKRWLEALRGGDAAARATEAGASETLRPPVSREVQQALAS